MRKPYLKVYREERQRSVWLCVDVGSHMQFGTRKVFKSVQAARLASLLGWSAHLHGDRVGGLLFGEEREQFFRPQRSQRAYLQFLRALSEANNPQHSAADTLQRTLQTLNRSSGTGALLFILADFLQTPAQHLQKALSQLPTRSGVIANKRSSRAKATCNWNDQIHRC